MKKQYAPVDPAVIGAFARFPEHRKKSRSRRAVNGRAAALLVKRLIKEGA